MTPDNTLAKLADLIAQVRGAHPEVDVRCSIESWDPHTLVEADAEVVRQAEQAVVTVLGYRPKHRQRTGTTDARFINRAGIPCLVAFGPGDVLAGNIHGEDESLGIDDLVNFTKIYAALILQVCCRDVTLLPTHGTTSSCVRLLSTEGNYGR